jgi:hypothetical protein
MIKFIFVAFSIIFIIQTADAQNTRRRQSLVVIKGDTIDLNNLSSANINQLKDGLELMKQNKEILLTKAEKLATKQLARSARDLIDDDETDKVTAEKLAKSVKKLRANNINVITPKTIKEETITKTNDNSSSNKATEVKGTIAPTTEENVYYSSSILQDSLRESNMAISIKTAQIEALQQALSLKIAALDLKNAQQRTYYLISIAVFSILSLIAFNFYRHNKIRKKANELLATEKKLTELEREKSENLLLNILPASVASELKEKGNAPVKYYERATVLFTDFKGFTNVAEKMSPSELVGELDNCFAKFDEIIENHNLEKIKTIGDAYMCVGGIPNPNITNPFDAVLAGLEMQEFMEKQHEERAKEGKEYWHCRLGINSGELIAGVIGYLPNCQRFF